MKIHQQFHKVVFCVSRDGLKESKVVTKAFTVENTGSPGGDDDFESAVSYRDENDYRPTRSRYGPHHAIQGHGATTGSKASLT